VRSSRAFPCSLSLLLCSAGSLGCSTSANQGATDAGTFVAFASDFSGFHSWPSTPGVAPDGAPPPPTGDAGVHFGPLTTYINKRPPPGSTSFPVGTIIVKEPNDPPLLDRQIFAMVKRGGGYDSSGAIGWEFFGLRNLDANDVTILWRGVGPPTGEAYGSDVNVCKDCHAGARSNDFVWTEGLELSRL
jgi:hypothetical protein